MNESVPSPTAGISRLENLPESPWDLIDSAYVSRLPMVTKFRGITEREVMLIEGPAGWAEFSPFLEYGAAESARWLRACLEFAGFLGPVPGEATVAEVAPSVSVNATLPACPVSEVESVLARFGAVTTVKAKVAEHGLASLPEDLARLGEFRRLFPDAVLRVDANARYGVDEAVEALSVLAPFGLQYAEQPVAAVEDLVRVRGELSARGIPVVIAADESIRKAEDPLRVAELGAAEVIIVKVQPLGGIEPALEVIGRSGLPAVVSSALESSVGLVAGARLATVLPTTERSRVLLGPDPACGLGTASFFAEDVVASPLRPRDGRIGAERLGPDLERLNALAADPQRIQWWRTRVEQCWDVLRHPATDA